MPHRHENDVPGDIIGSQARNLPGGFGIDDPDANLDATIDELVDNDAAGLAGQRFVPTDPPLGLTTGTGYTDAVSDGASVAPEDLGEGGEAGTPLSPAS